ncbi:hypothetical protein [Burkholderia dolosa]|uniref:hypothetical protein n=1 Tax=Burkholderia dolosa TaxID=152500 RepID=UPI001C97AD8E|nr:hypothetical protein [Burkholderia dolosa]MBY4917618.1 hypothetical protein [Burkholderia dolosa]
MKAEFVPSPIVKENAIWVVSVGKVCVGVDSIGTWSIDLNGNVRAVKSPEDTMPLLPILELDRDNFVDGLKRIAREFPDFENQVASFPENLLIEFALDSSVSEYWPSKALNWIEGAPALISIFSPLMKSVIDRKWATQSIKQRIGRLIKSI